MFEGKLAQGQSGKQRDSIRIKQHVGPGRMASGLEHDEPPLA